MEAVKERGEEEGVNVDHIWENQLPNLTPPPFQYFCDILNPQPFPSPIRFQTPCQILLEYLRVPIIKRAITWEFEF